MVSQFVFCECGHGWDGSVSSGEHECHKDSGDNMPDGQQLKSGEKKDEGKARWDLLAYDAIEGIVKVLTMGAKKYAPRNWELGIPYGRVFAAIQRHLTAYWRGESRDPESGLSHLDHALCGLMFLSAYEKRGMTQLDDRPEVRGETKKKKK